ncbi:MAG: cutinase, partial [Mycobacterium sp.]|nr:cutinase [Mycobacterium sp.]
MKLRALCTAGLLAAALVVAPAFARTGPTLIPTASAACPDAEVVFARGRLESPGAGVLGNAFTSALRSRVNKNVSLYAVRYPA